MLVVAGVALGMAVGWARAAESAATQLEQLRSLLRTSDTKGVLRRYESLPNDVTVPSRLQHSVAARYRSAGRYDQAKTIYQSLLSADPTDDAARRGLVMTLFDAGSFSQAMQILDSSGGPRPVVPPATDVAIEPPPALPPEPAPVETVPEPAPEPVPVETVPEPAPEPTPTELEAGPKEQPAPPYSPAEAKTPPGATTIVEPLSPPPERVAEDTVTPQPVETNIVTPVQMETDTVAPETVTTNIVAPVQPPSSVVETEPVETVIVTPTPIEGDSAVRPQPPAPVETDTEPPTIVPVPVDDGVGKPETVAENVTEPEMADTGPGQTPLFEEEPIELPPPVGLAPAPVAKPPVAPPVETPDAPETPAATIADEEPADPTTALARALELFEADKREEAMDVLSEALSLHPDDVHLLYTKAQIQRTCEDYAGALNTCERILELSPGDENVLDLKARLLVARARATASDEAVGLYEQALALIGDDPLVLSEYVQALCLAGRGNDAIAHYEQLPPEARESVDLAKAMGPCYLVAKQYDKACDAYEIIVSKQPENLAVGKSLVAMQFDIKRYDDTLRTIDLLLAHHDGDVELLYTKALIHQEKEQLDESIAACESILAVDPEHAAATDLKARLLVARAGEGEGASAQRMLKEALALTSDAPEVAEPYIQSLCRAGKNAEAITRFEALPAEYEPSLATRKSVAKCYFDERRFKDARPLYESILAEDPNDQVALRGLVTLLFNLGEYNKAVETLSRATLTPADIPGRSSL